MAGVFYGTVGVVVGSGAGGSLGLLCSWCRGCGSAGGAADGLRDALSTLPNGAMGNRFAGALRKDVSLTRPLSSPCAARGRYPLPRERPSPFFVR